ncbi:hypothetical protein M9H77_06317 [Catharanthus roseus]|uniref:Uncharacterized protein n=1 Tax=Catharanthus roseus TaxID=4058 RepID=A0ACC0BRS0_CATRO|nr:hypothetical protein M9H77_06317 [Catharanthus roseus]
MVKVKNANAGRGEKKYEERGSSRGERTRKGKGKKVASESRLPEMFISVKAATNFEEWTKKRRKITPRHRHGFKRMGFSRNEEGVLVRGQEDDDESDEEEDDDEGQDAMDVEDETKGGEKYKMQYIVDGIIYFVDGIMLMPYDVECLRRTKNAQKKSQ